MHTTCIQVPVYREVVHVTKTDAAEGRWVFLLQTYGLAATTTMLVWALVTWQGGLPDTLLIIELTVLEMLFSFDNAAVNSSIVGRLSPFWQSMFMTVGIFFAVIVVRFVLPLLIVQYGAHTSFLATLDMAQHHPAAYTSYVEKAMPIIGSSGGIFLLTAGGFSLFEDNKKDVVFVALAVIVTMYLTTPQPQSVRSSALFGSICGLTACVGLDRLGELLEPEKTQLVLYGFAAFFMFLRGEALDASFSLDGVFGGLSVTKSIGLMMAGLGNGAVWVRSMTVHMVKREVHERLPHLKDGAMVAVLLLGVSFLAQRYGLETPSWVTGSVGLVCVAMAVAMDLMPHKQST